MHGTDFQTLRPWIQPEHLDPDCLKSMRENLRAHPARMLIVDDFLAAGPARSLSVFLTSEAAYETTFKLKNGAAVSEEQWHDTKDEERFYHASLLVGPRAEFRLSSNLVAFLKFQQVMRSRVGVSYLCALSGYELGALDFSIRAMGVGAVVAAHVDDYGTRYLAHSLYLTPDWQSRYGGALHVRHPDGTVSTVMAQYNRLVLFDASIGTLHSVERVNELCGKKMRVSIGGWAYRRAQDQGAKAGGLPSCRSSMRA